MSDNKVDLPVLDPIEEIRRGGVRGSIDNVKNDPYQVVINPSKLKENKLFIATPMYGGQCSGMYVKSILDLQTTLYSMGVENRFSFLFNESLITRARNYLVDEFLRSGYTHLLFLDSDIEFNPEDVLALMAIDKDIIGAPYPKKSVNWGNIYRAAQKYKEEEAGELEGLVGDYVFNVVPGTQQFNVFRPIQVMEIGTGYMMIKRHVFDKMRDGYPTLSYKPDHIGQQHFDGSRYIHAYFETVTDRGYTFDDVHRLMERAANGLDVKDEANDYLSREATASNRYLSEDYMFCQYWRALGGDVWLCPWMKTKHVGTYNFTGDMAKIAQMTGRLK